MLDFVDNPRFAKTLLVIVGAALLFAHSDASLLYRYDDAYFAATARQIVEEGSWLSPQLRDKPIFDKPPLTFWFEALSIRLFSATSASVRFPGSFLFLMMTIASWVTIRRLRGDREALISALIILTSHQLIFYARRPVTEIYVVVWSWLAALSYFDALQTDRGRSRVLCAAFLALAFMTKGIMGLLPIGPIVAHALLERQFTRLFVHRAVALGALLFAVIVVPWHVFMIQEYGDAFIDYYFWDTQLSFLTGTTHSDPWSMSVILKKVAETYWPWLLLLAFAITTSVRKQRALPEHERSWIRFLWLWCSLILLVFHLVYVKRDRYILPVYPAFAALIAWWVVQMRGSQWMQRGIIGFATLAVLFAMFSPSWTSIADYDHYGDKTGAMLALIESRSAVPVIVHQGDGYCFNCDTITYYTGATATPTSKTPPDEAMIGVRIFTTEESVRKFPLQIPAGLQAQTIYADEKAGVFVLIETDDGAEHTMKWPEALTNSWPGKRASAAMRATSSR